MTNPDYTDITFLLDRSGSMASIEQATVSGFAEFIAEQRRAPGKCLVSLSRFDTDYDRVDTAKPVADVPPHGTSQHPEPVESPRTRCPVGPLTSRGAHTASHIPPVAT